MPSLELCIPYYYCKCTAFEILTTKMFSRLFCSHKMHLLAHVYRPL